ncbi:MAG TPA: hypothetical protein VIY47_10530 [Ignavibacteriaceae bacterium]
MTQKQIIEKLNHLQITVKVLDDLVHSMAVEITKADARQKNIEKYLTTTVFDAVSKLENKVAVISDSYRVELHRKISEVAVLVVRLNLARIELDEFGWSSKKRLKQFTNRTVQAALAGGRKLKQFWNFITRKAVPAALAGGSKQERFKRLFWLKRGKRNKRPN